MFGPKTQCVVVVGAQWGDEGKGKIVDVLAERADLVVAGGAILDAVLRVWPAARIRVADRGLREGVLMQLMAKRR